MNNHPHGDTAARIHQAMEHLVASAAIEMIPLRSAPAALALLPAGSTVTITTSSRLGLDRTLELAAAAVAAGFRVVPHLAARQLADVAELRTFVRRTSALGITDLYVIGGDAPTPAGVFDETSQVLESLTEFEHGLTSIGVACYPEGHPAIPDDTLTAALARKASLADYMVSQLCFDPDALTAWLCGVRDQGITLPLHVGLAAPLKTRKLAELSMKIGVGASLRYLTKQHGMVGKLLLGRSYRPETFLTGLGGSLLAEDPAVDGVHLFSFNQIAATVAWQRHVAGSIAA